MKWHRCERYWREGLECPFRELEAHEEVSDDDDDERDEPLRFPPLLVPEKRKPQPPRMYDVIEVAEGILRDTPREFTVPDPVPEPPPEPPVVRPRPVPPGVPQPVPVGVPVPPDRGEPGGAPWVPPGPLRPAFRGFGVAQFGEALAEATVALAVGIAIPTGLGFIFSRIGQKVVPALSRLNPADQLGFVEGTVARYLSKAAAVLGGARLLGIPSSNREEPEKVPERFPFHRGHFVNFTEYLDGELRRPELQASDAPKSAVMGPPVDPITLNEDYE